MRTTPAAVVRRRLLVDGVVQGVGFRPFVHHLAVELGLSGLVGNDASGVFIEVEGTEEAVEQFCDRLVVDAPPLASIERVTSSELAPSGVVGFDIVSSRGGSGPRTLVPPDVATCPECMSEVLDPTDRRYRYPFANCTNCGPRFTVITGLPYDRASTTMAGFPLCPACQAEYGDPADRRYHAEPVACPECGPKLEFVRGAEVLSGTDRALEAAQLSFARGEVVAVKGLGGYHLGCDATSDSAVELLRQRKARSEKPFAVMVPDLASARLLAELDEAEERALTSLARPIVLLRRRNDARLSARVAPGNSTVGVMLAYSPLHHLLFSQVPGSEVAPPSALVLTSGNRSDEPICIDDEDATRRLGDLVDAFLRHDRPIHVPCDDSVVRVVDGELQPVRRSRGYAPLPVVLPVEVAPVLAVGGELKNTFCLAVGRHAWVSQHLGDMANFETLEAFSRSVEEFSSMYGVEPERFAVDRHPGYLTRRFATEHVGDATLVEVQHHHAHIASVMAEHGLDGSSPVIGIAFDGTGYGISDSGQPEIWGGEVLVSDYAGFERVGHLRALPLAGGDGAVHNPCRIAVGYLCALGIARAQAIPAVAAMDDVERAVVERQIATGSGCVSTTSVGRLFDAVASLLGVCHRASYEAQAAIELEALAASATARALNSPSRFELAADGVLDPEGLLRRLVEGVLCGEDRGELALEFHIAVADSITSVAELVREARGPLPVALSGGVFQNALLEELSLERLRRVGFAVLTNRLIPPNDGGLSLGQAIIAGLRRG